jgi:hypothetical protein
MALTGVWKLNGNANDSVGGNNGTASGSYSWVAGGPIGSGYISTSGGKVDITTADTGSPFSCLVSYQTSQAGSQGCVFENYTTAGLSTNLHWLAINRNNVGGTLNGALNVHTSDSSSSDAYNAASANDGKWHRVGYCRNAPGTYTVYFDSVPKTMTGSFKTGDVTGTKIVIGQVEGGGIPLTGGISDLRFDNSEYSAAKFKNDWASLKGFF